MAITDQELEFTTFEPQVHDESVYYGIDFKFKLEVGELGGPDSRSYLGELSVGGLLHETEDIEGVVVRYWAKQLWPYTRIEPVRGQFVMQSFSIEQLERKARRAVSSLQDRVMFAEITGDPENTDQSQNAMRGETPDASEHPEGHVPNIIVPNEKYL